MTLIFNYYWHEYSIDECSSLQSLELLLQVSQEKYEMTSQDLTDLLLIQKIEFSRLLTHSGDCCSLWKNFLSNLYKKFVPKSFVEIRYTPPLFFLLFFSRSQDLYSNTSIQLLSSPTIIIVYILSWMREKLDLVRQFISFFLAGLPFPLFSLRIFLRSHIIYIRTLPWAAIGYKSC